MKELRLRAYLPLCEQYEAMAQNFFKQYQDLSKETNQFGESYDILENPHEALDMCAAKMHAFQAAICAIVFEAFAIESYVNLFGAYHMGDSAYREKYESSKPHYSTIEKIKLLCKNEFQTPYPTGGSHFAALKNIFKKRGKLAHNKPASHEITAKSESPFDDYSEAIEEVSFVTNGLDEEMKLYQTVKQNLISASKQPDPIVSQQDALQNALLQAFQGMWDVGCGNYDLFGGQ